MQWIKYLNYTYMHTNICALSVVHKNMYVHIRKISNHHSKCSVKRKVLSLDLKAGREVTSLRLAGSEFQTIGAIWLNVRPPRVFKLGLFGGSSLFTVDDLTGFEYFLVTRVSLKY